MKWTIDNEIHLFQIVCQSHEQKEKINLGKATNRNDHRGRVADNPQKKKRPDKVKPVNLKGRFSTNVRCRSSREVKSRSCSLLVS
jgi:hypothetical protein